MDKYLEVLKDFQEEDLKQLISLMSKKWSFELNKTILNNPKKHIDKIADELLKFAGNTIANFYRSLRNVRYKQIPKDGLNKSLKNIYHNRKGVSYREMLYDVCKKSKVQITQKSSIEVMEERLLIRKEQDMQDMLDNMSQDERETFLKEFAGFMKKKYGIILTNISQLTVKILVKVHGIRAYYALNKFVIFIFREILKKTAPKWLLFGGLQQVLKFVVGPLGWALWVWTIIDIASPSYKVCIPATILIASNRAELNIKD
ncbi:MAG: hypothetical protein LBR69_00460 [Endomicrobium sp.]|jgi:uncharacterized protein YaaW (UPF0174 family)|nr:hypothetical protein [Endomicrobium sp.]